MEIKVFQKITTEEALCEIEENAKKYEDLYVDMDNKEERKFVKDSASLITSILKKLDRARIDTKKEYGLTVEAEAKKIRERLELANKPFTSLIDEHKEKRAKILAEQKRIEEEKQAKVQKELDHEEAIGLNKLFDLEKREREERQRIRDEEIAKNAAKEAEERSRQLEVEKALAEERAKQAEADAKKRAEEAAELARKQEIERQEAEKQAEKERIEKLEANKRHVSKICKQAKESFMKNKDISEPLAKEIVKMIAKGEVDNVSINY